MVRPRAGSEIACIVISRHHRRECKEDLTSRIHTITLHKLERIKDEDEKKSRLRVKIWSVRGRVRGWVFLGDGDVGYQVWPRSPCIVLSQSNTVCSWTVEAYTSLTLLSTQRCNCRVVFVFLAWWQGVSCPLIYCAILSLIDNER